MQLRAASDRAPQMSSSPRSKATRATATRWSRASPVRPRLDAIDLWSGKGSAAMAFGPHVTVHPVFRRRTRLPQMLFLLRRLLRAARARRRHHGAAKRPGARRSRGAADACRPIGSSCISTGSANTPASSVPALVAARQPDIVILGTTEQRGRRVPSLRFRERGAAPVSRARAGGRDRHGSVPAVALCGRRAPGQGLRDRRRSGASCSLRGRQTFRSPSRSRRSLRQVRRRDPRGHRASRSDALRAADADPARRRHPRSTRRTFRAASACSRTIVPSSATASAA